VACYRYCHTCSLQAEGFWEVYSHIIRPNDVQTALDLHLFRDGIKPMWEVRHPASRGHTVGASTTSAQLRYCLLSLLVLAPLCAWRSDVFAVPRPRVVDRLSLQDPSNAKGGKWAVHLKKGLATHFWEMLVR
jgi:hypothetical protein